MGTIVPTSLWDSVSSDASGFWDYITGQSPEPPQYLGPNVPKTDPNTGLPVSLTPVASTASAVPTDSVSQSNFIAAQLRQVNMQLLALEQQVLQNNGTDFSKQMGPLVGAARQRYATLLNGYIYAYGAAFGHPPDTTGLAQWQVYVIAGASIAVIFAAVVEIEQYITGVLQPKAQAMLQNSQNCAYALNQASMAQKSGDQAGYAKWMAVAQGCGSQGSSVSSATDWLKENWAWVALGAAGLIILPDLL